MLRCTTIGSEPITPQAGNEVVRRRIMQIEDAELDESRAHLIAAAEVARRWAYNRRATWTDRPLAVSPGASASERVSIARPTVDVVARPDTLTEPLRSEPTLAAVVAADDATTAP